MSEATLSGSITAQPDSNYDKFTFATPDSSSDYIGFFFKGKGALESFFSVKCPCGVLQSVPVNEFPTVDTPHMCGKPNHWLVKFGD